MYKEKYQLTEKELIALVNGKSLHFVVPDAYEIRILPPNHGITISYANWMLIKSYLMGVNLPFKNMETFIKNIEERK